jgi:hypothetical protein
MPSYDRYLHALQEQIRSVASLDSLLGSWIK